MSEAREKFKKIPVSIDIETNGLDPFYHEILQIAIIPYDKKSLKPSENRFVQRIKPSYPERSYEKALKINGISIDDISPENDPLTIKESLKVWIQSLDCEKVKLELLGHNILSFDILFLKMWFSEKDEKNNTEYDKYFHYHAIDTYQVARTIRDAGLLKLDSLSLGSLCEYFKIKARAAHDSESDALCALEAYGHLIKRLNPFNIFVRSLLGLIFKDI